MSTRRMVVFWCEDTQAAEDLVTAVDLARRPAWNAPFILDRLRRSGAKIALGAQVIVP